MNLINLTIHRPDMAIKVNLVSRALVWDVRALDISPSSCGNLTSSCVMLKCVMLKVKAEPGDLWRFFFSCFSDSPSLFWI